MARLRQQQEYNQEDIARLEIQNRHIGKRWTEAYIRESRWSDLESMTDDQLSLETRSDKWKQDPVYQTITAALATAAPEKKYQLESMKRAMEQRTMAETQYLLLVDTSVDDLIADELAIAGK